MRDPNLGTVQYTPNQVPEDAAEMRRFLFEELNRIAAAISLLAAGHDDELHAEPPKPRTGNRVLADGTDWDPGSGQGVYSYYGGAWHKLG